MLCDAERPTRAHFHLLVLAFLGWMFDFYDLILYTFLVKPISAELGFTHMDHAVALGISFTATAVGGIASGFLADRYGRRTVVSWTIALYSLGSLWTGLSPTKAWLLAGRAVTGMGVGGEWAAGHALIAETFPAAHRGRAGAILQTGAPVGVGLATLVGTVLVPRLGWRACLVGSSATALLAFAARRAMPESDVWLAGKSTRFGEGFAQLVAGRLFWLALVLTTVNGASYWLTYSWLPEYLRARHVDPGRYMAFIVGGEVLGYAVFGWVSDRLGRRPAFTAFTVVMAAGLVPLTVGWQRFPPPILYTACALVGIGTGTWSNFGPMLAELFPTQTRNTGMGTIFNASRAVQFGAPVLIAALEPRYGLASGIGLAAAFALAAGGWIWLLPETRAKAMQEPAMSARDMLP